MLLSILTAVASFLSWVVGIDIEPDVAACILAVVYTLVIGVLANIFV